MLVIDNIPPFKGLVKSVSTKDDIVVMGKYVFKQLHTQIKVGRLVLLSLVPLRYGFR